jgi:hypothetical protein
MKITLLIFSSITLAGVGTMTVKSVAEVSKGQSLHLSG